MTNSSFSCLYNLILNSDIFGQEVKLLLNNQEKSKTICGGFFSIILLIFLSILFLINSFEIISKQNPIISIEQQILNSNITLDKYTFPFALVLTDSNNKVVFKPNYFNYKVSVREINKDFEKSEKILNLANCKKEFFPLISQEIYDSYMMNKFLCLENFENENFTISGSSMMNKKNSFFSYLTISLSICTNEPQCAPYEDISDFLKTQNLFFNIFFQTSNINIHDTSNNPVKYNLENFQKYLKLNYSKKIDFFIRNENLQSDEGIFFHSIKTINSPSLSYDSSTYEETEIFINQKIQNLIEFNFFSSNKNIIYHRSYPKILTVISNIGGLMYLLKNFLAYLCYIFSFIKKDEIILNKIFDFDFDYIEEEMNQGPGAGAGNMSRMNGVKSENLNLNLNINNTSNVFFFNRRREALNSVNNISNLNKLESLHLGIGMSLSPLKGTESNLKMIKIFNKNNEKKTEKNLEKILDKNLEKNEKNFEKNFEKNLEKNVKTENNHENDSNSHIEPHLKFGNEINPKQKSLFKFNSPKDLITNLELRKNKNKLKFNFCEILICYFLPCLINTTNKTKIKKKLYNEGKSVLNSLLDIGNIINKLEEFEKLKLIILNYDQLALFNYRKLFNCLVEEFKQ
jgi:hypothetical protein